MRLTRRLITLSLLVIYAAQPIGAHPVHLGHCSGEASVACHEGASCGLTGEPPKDLACSGGSDDHLEGQGAGLNEQGVDREHGHHDSSHESPRPHDSAHCKLCRVLGQAQQPATAFGLVSVLHAAPVSNERAPNFYTAPRRSGFQSRAPPAV